jgi:hypothetical protein
MSAAGTRPIAPSSKLALYLSAVIGVYVIGAPSITIGVAVAFMAIGLVVLHNGRRPVPRPRWRAVIVFVAWVFLMRLALDLVAGVPIHDRAMWLAAGRQAARVAVLGVGVIVLIAVTTPRDTIEELERSRLPRSARLLVMMLVQYPRVLRARHDQILEAQVARGADRPRTVPQRVARGMAVLLPVMQSELNAIGERTALIYLRGLDLEVPVEPGVARRSRQDFVALITATLVVAVAFVVRFSSR